MSAMRDEDAAKEEQLERMHTSEPDPFQRIFERNNMSGDEIPGFYNANSNGDASIIPGGNTIAGVSLAATAGGTVVGAGRRKGRTVPLMKHETPSADLIKQRIHMRRSMNVSIAMNQHMAAIQKYDGEMGEGDNASVLSFLGRNGNNASENVTQAAASYVPKVNTQRRNSDQMELVGEVAGTSSTIIDQYDGASFIEDGGSYHRAVPPQIQHQDEQDSRQMAPYYSRANQQPVVMYRRTSMEGPDGGQTVSQQVGQLGAQRRPVRRAPLMN